VIPPSGPAPSGCSQLSATGRQSTVSRLIANCFCPREPLIKSTRRRVPLFWALPQAGASPGSLGQRTTPASSWCGRTRPGFENVRGKGAGRPTRRPDGACSVSELSRSCLTRTVTTTKNAEVGADWPSRPAEFDDRGLTFAMGEPSPQCRPQTIPRRRRPGRPSS